jgi:uncharacterized membrane-anchored protein YjiN (DUF445 family)
LNDLLEKLIADLKEQQKGQRRFTDQEIQNAIAKYPKEQQKTMQEMAVDLKNSWLLEDLIDEARNLLDPLLKKHLSQIAKAIPGKERQYKDWLKQIVDPPDYP